MPHDAALQDHPDARVRREPMRLRPEPTRRRSGPRPEDIGFGPRFVAATSFGSVLNPVNSSIIAVALVSIGHAFGVGTSATTWLVSALYLATAIGQPTMGRLADLVGPRRVYLFGTVSVAVGGLLGCLGWSLGSLIAARIVIGLGTSAAYPAAMAMVRHQARRLNREAPGSVLGALAIAGQATMAVGPPLGGLLIAVGGWRLTFLVNVPLAVVGIAAVLAWLPADGQRVRISRAWHELDPPGLVLFAAALTGLLLFPDVTGQPSLVAARRHRRPADRTDRARTARVHAVPRRAHAGPQPRADDALVRSRRRRIRARRPAQPHLAAAGGGGRRARHRLGRPAAAHRALAAADRHVRPGPRERARRRLPGQVTRFSRAPPPRYHPNTKGNHHGHLAHHRLLDRPRASACLDGPGPRRDRRCDGS
jgi:hypothetical protein